MKLYFQPIEDGDTLTRLEKAQVQLEVLRKKHQENMIAIQNLNLSGAYLPLQTSLTEIEQRMQQIIDAVAEDIQMISGQVNTVKT